jgi:hypothetical protein
LVGPYAEKQPVHHNCNDILANQSNVSLRVSGFVSFSTIALKKQKQQEMSLWRRLIFQMQGTSAEILTSIVFFGSSISAVQL